jgi:hypothetical protein
MVATGGFRQKTQLRGLEQELDVLIATPGRFLYLLQEGFVQLSSLRWYGSPLSFFSLHIFVVWTLHHRRIGIVPKRMVNL